jgi:hypothetical protein
MIDMGKWVIAHADVLIGAVAGAVLTVLTTIIGWLVKRAIEKRANKTNLRFEIVQDPDVPILYDPDKLFAAEGLLTKTSPSGYCLRVHNYGSEPVYYDHFELSLGKRKNYYNILYWPIEDELDPVLPHNDKFHVMDQQDFIQLMRVCEKKEFERAILKFGRNTFIA